MDIFNVNHYKTNEYLNQIKTAFNEGKRIQINSINNFGDYPEKNVEQIEFGWINGNDYYKQFEFEFLNLLIYRIDPRDDVNSLYYQGSIEYGFNKGKKRVQIYLNPCQPFIYKLDESGHYINPYPCWITIENPSFNWKVANYRIHPDDLNKDCTIKEPKINDYFSSEYQAIVKHAWFENPSIPRQWYNNYTKNWQDCNDKDWISTFIYRLKVEKKLTFDEMALEACQNYVDENPDYTDFTLWKTAIAWNDKIIKQGNDKD